MRTLLLLTALLLPFVSADAHAKPLGLVTGAPTGTYIAFGRDIAALAKAKGVEVEVKPSGGSIDNIKRMSSKENAALGIVQSDVLGFLSRSRNPETIKIASHLRMVLPLYKEEVHVLARNGIKSLKDLKGKKVVIGEEGSGHMLTAVNLLSMFDIKVADTLRLSPPEGVVAVLQGEADAVIFVGGKPVKLFKNLEDLAQPGNEEYAELLKNVHFLPLNEPRMLEEYHVAEITHDDYHFVTENVPTIAVTAVLVAYDFSQGKTALGKERCAQLGTLADAVRSNIETLKQSGHPKWKEVDLDASVGFWEQDACSAARKINGQASKPAGSKKLLGIVDKSDR